MAPSSNKQWTTVQDGLEKLEFTEGDVPTPKDGEVLVRINAVSLNYRDTEGVFPHSPNPVKICAE